MSSGSKLSRANWIMSSEPAASDGSSWVFPAAKMSLSSPKFRDSSTAKSTGLSGSGMYFEDDSFEARGQSLFSDNLQAIDMDVSDDEGKNTGKKANWLSKYVSALTHLVHFSA